MILADRLQAAFGGGRGVAGGIEIEHFQVVARRVLDQHRLVGAEERREIEQLIGIVHAADDFADAAAEMAADDLHGRELLENAAHDQPRQ